MTSSSNILDTGFLSRLYQLEGAAGWDRLLDLDGQLILLPEIETEFARLGGDIVQDFNAWRLANSARIEIPQISMAQVNAHFSNTRGNGYSPRVSGGRNAGDWVIRYYLETQIPPGSNTFARVFTLENALTNDIGNTYRNVARASEGLFGFFEGLLLSGKINFDEYTDLWVRTEGNADIFKAHGRDIREIISSRGRLSREAFDALISSGADVSDLRGVSAFLKKLGIAGNILSVGVAAVTITTLINQGEAAAAEQEAGKFIGGFIGGAAAGTIGATAASIVFGAAAFAAAPALLVTAAVVTTAVVAGAYGSGAGENFAQGLVDDLQQRFGNGGPLLLSDVEESIDAVSEEQGVNLAGYVEITEDGTFEATPVRSNSTYAEVIQGRSSTNPYEDAEFIGQLPPVAQAIIDLRKYTESFVDPLDAYFIDKYKENSRAWATLASTILNFDPDWTEAQIFFEGQGQGFVVAVRYANRAEEEYVVQYSPSLSVQETEIYDTNSIHLYNGVLETRTEIRNKETGRTVTRAIGNLDDDGKLTTATIESFLSDTLGKRVELYSDNLTGLFDATRPSLFAVDTDLSAAERLGLYNGLGGIIGSGIGSLLGGQIASDGAAGIAADIVSSAVFGQIGSAFGRALAGNIDPNDTSTFIDRLVDQFNGSEEGDVVADAFSIGALSEALEQGVKGTVSSFLAAELADVLGLDGTAGEVFGVVGNSLINSVLRDANGALDVLNATGDVFEGFADVVFNQDFSALSEGGALSSLPGALGSFLGGKLGSLVVSPTTQAGAVLSSLGSSAGAFIASTFLTSSIKFVSSVLIPGIGAFVGFVLGALIGNLFGKKPPPIPMADASTVLNFNNGYYELGAVNSNESGNEAFAKNMAETAANTLNIFIDIVGGTDLDARNVNTISPTQIYGHEGNQTYVTIAGVRNDVDTPDEAIDIGALYAIRRTEIAGGNLMMKRAVLQSSANDLSSLAGDLQTADDYAIYLRNQDIIDEAIAAPYESLSQSDKDFYDANEARFLAVQRIEQAPLTGSNITWYNNNQSRVDDIIETLNSVSTFAAGWIITLQRAAELGLNKSAESDFYGGAQGFIDSLSGLVNRPISYQDIAFTMDGEDLKVYFDANRDGHADTATEEILFTETGMTRAIGHADGGAGYNLATSIGSFGSGNDIQVMTATDTNANRVTNDGDDIIIGNANNNLIDGHNGRDWLDGGAGADTITGGADEDVIMGRDGDDYLYGDDGDDVIFAGTGYDRTFGGNGDDILHGGAHIGPGFRRNIMQGGAGDDTFITYASVDTPGGRDYFYGGTGYDIASFENYDTGITFAMLDIANFHWYDFDGNFFLYSSIEGTKGTSFADHITGNSSDNTLIGGAGDDVLTSGGGSNILEGGAGADTLIGNYTNGNRNTLSYESSLGGVDVSLGASAGAPNSHAFGGDASGDIIQGVFFNITGSNYSDVLEGDYRSNTLNGLDGDDYFIASRGYDVYNGGRGFDTVDYSNHAGESGLIINTVLGNSANGFDNGNENHILWGLHNYSEIEHIVGTDGADTITTGDLDNVLEGGAGNDILTGGNGNDIYFVEVTGGHDVINEGANGGYDTVMLGAADYTWNEVVISDLGANFVLTVEAYGAVATAYNSPSIHREDVGVDAIDIGGVGAIDIWHLNSDGGGDVTQDANGRDVHTGIAGKNNLLQGYGGQDVLYGHTQNDLLLGGRGNDSLFGGTGDDQYVFDRDISAGKNWDIIYDLGGIDHIQLGPNVRAEELVFTILPTRDHLYIGIAPEGTTDTTGLVASAMDDYIIIAYGGDLTSGRMVEYITVDNINIDLRTLDLPFKNAPAGNGNGNGVNNDDSPIISAPIVFDLNNNGYTDVVGIDESKIVIQNGQNQYTRIGWIGAEDGILGLDRNGNGIIDNVSEISFLGDLEGATSDIDALRAYDSNQDGVFDANDARFGEFRILQDHDQNGIGSTDELVSLADAGIASIDLAAQSLGRDIRDNADNVNLNMTHYETTSGERRTAYDVALGASIISGGQESYSSAVSNLSIATEFSADAVSIGANTATAGALGSVSFDRSAFIENEILNFDVEGLSDEQVSVVSEVTQGAWAQLGRNQLDRMVRYRDGMMNTEQGGTSALDMFDTGQSEASVNASFAASRSPYSDEGQSGVVSDSQSGVNTVSDVAFVPTETLGVIATVQNLVASNETQDPSIVSAELDIFNQAMAAFGGTNGTGKLMTGDHMGEEKNILGQSSIWRRHNTNATLIA